MPLVGRDIICLASSSWDAMWVNAQHLMSRLAADNRVLYVNNLGLRAPGKNKGDWAKVRRRLGEWFSGAQKKADNLWVLSPVSVPLHQSAAVRSFNRWSLIRSLRGHARRLGFQRPILWTFLPLGVELIGQLDESLVVYHCVDEYAANPGVAVDELRAMEDALLRRADLVFATNPVLYEERKDRSKRAVYVGNVAHTPHFEPSTQRDIPEKLRHLPRPILGYTGNISGYKTDLELLVKTARAMNEGSLVLVGPVGWGDPSTDVTALQELPNVHFIGRVDYDELPAYVAAFDICLMPLRVNESTRRSFPMKFYEYMAAGKPIVSVDLPAFDRYRTRPELCRVAADHDDFLEAICRTIADQGDYTDARLTEARANSWDVRVREIGATVAAALAEKEARG
ncbi:MAG TPA: glycosyltransferase [bacterium]|nr:glycosyltransferase [bacterium]